MRGLKHAFAIPLGNSGTIEIVLTDHPATCTYWTDSTFADRCDVWRARISLPASAQRPGRYRIEQNFAYLDRKATGAKGAWQSAGACEGGGGNMKGEIEIIAISQSTIEARLCDTATEDPRDHNLVRGSFVAQRCPACGMTRDRCSTNADCCSGNCGSGGHCGP